jgi:5-methylcytosine-specific restriction endonuclease McrA
MGANQGLTWGQKNKIAKIRDRKRISQNHKCFYCSHAFRDNPEKNNRKRCTADHLVPICKGGAKTDEKNIVAACAKCNINKGNMSYDEFIIAQTKPKKAMQYDIHKRERFNALRSEVDIRNRPLSLKEKIFTWFKILPERQLVLILP